MKVQEWFGYWFERHQRRHPRADWPRLAENPEFYRGWIGNFVLHGVTEDVADEASERLMADPPRFLADHVRDTLATSKAIFRERAERGEGVEPDSREAAERASLRCPDCEGQGLTLRYRHRGAGMPGSDGRPHGPTITLCCTCPMGRWTERTLRRESPEVRGRLYDLADHPWLRLGPVPWSDEPDNKFRWHPDLWDDIADRPMPARRLAEITARSAITPVSEALRRPPRRDLPRRPDPLPPLKSPVPSVGEVDGRLVRRHRGEIQESPIF